MGAADKRDSDSEEADGGQHSQPEQVWKTQPVIEETYNGYYKEREEGAKYEKDSRTGLWLVAVSEEACKASQGFVCKVRFDNPFSEWSYDHANDHVNSQYKDKLDQVLISAVA